MILFLYGPDTFRLNEKINELKKESFNWVEANSFEEFCLAEKKQSLFSPKAKTIFINPLSEDFLEIKNSENRLVFYSSNPDKRTRVFKHLVSVSETSEFLILSGKPLETWIIKRTSITLKAAFLLAYLVGGDLWRLDREIKKLEAFVNYEKSIEEKDVKLLITSKIDPNIFETLDALARGEKKRALYLLTHHLYRGDDEHYLFSMFTYQFRTLFKIATSEIEGLHPFVIKKSRLLLEHYSLERLKVIYEKLLLLDFQSKRGMIERPATFFCLLYEAL